MVENNKGLAEITVMPTHAREGTKLVADVLSLFAVNFLGKISEISMCLIREDEVKRGGGYKMSKLRLNRRVGVLTIVCRFSVESTLFLLVKSLTLLANYD